MGDRVRAEAARRGLSLGELDAELGWPEGRTEDLLARPSKLSHEDVRLLSETLGIPMTSIFELDSPEGSRLGDDGQP